MLYKYKDKSDNVERVYSVYFDGEKLKDLLNEIVRNVSYRTNGKFNPPYNASFEGNVFTSGADLPNGDPMYENIKSIYRYTSDDPYYGYHDDSVAVEGILVTPPRLAFIIKDILSYEANSIDEFIDYANCDELIPIDEKIDAANKAVDEIDNFDYDKKIDALNWLKRYCEDKKAKKYFDVELLKKYYSQARSLFELELESEKIYHHSERVLLSDCKLSK